MEICKQVSSAVHKSSGKTQSFFSRESEEVQVVLSQPNGCNDMSFQITTNFSASFSSSGRVEVSPIQAQSYLGVTQTWVYRTVHVCIEHHLPYVTALPVSYPSCLHATVASLVPQLLSGQMPVHPKLRW